MPRTVLLADDSVTAQNMGRRILMDAGYEVITVNNGSAALKKIHESRPDLIVLDVYMPGYGGLEVCQRLKESGETMRIPVLLTVGKMEPFKAEEAKRVRADGHIIKPFEASELLAALTRLEDRIVPQAESGRIIRSKKSHSTEKKSRFWPEEPDPHSEQGGSDRSAEIARLAEAKKKQEQVAEPAAAVELEATTASHEAAVARAAQEEQEQEEQPAVTFASASEPEQAGSAKEPAAEFAVTRPEAEDINSEAFEPQEPPAEVAAVESVSEASQVAAVAGSSAPRWVAENVPVTREEASIALEQEMQQAQLMLLTASVEDRNEDVRGDDVDPTPAPAASKSEEDESESSGALAAAASASASGSSVNAFGNSMAVSEPEPAVPSEAAAAWENWQQIRESVMASQQTEAIAESVALLAQTSETTSATESTHVPAEPEQAEAASSSLAETEGLASLVDSVLAELKPKLMAEIAKKLAAEKK